MPYCQQCGSEVGDDWEFCHECGSELPSQSGNSQSNPPQQNSSQRRTKSPPRDTGQESNQVQQTAPPQSQQSSSAQSQPLIVDRQWTPDRVLVIIACAVVGVGAYLPWVTASALGQSVSIQGMDELGLPAIVLAGLLGIFVILEWNEAIQGFAILVGLLIGVIGGIYVLDPLASTDLSAYPDWGREILRRVVEPGIGAFLTALGGIGIVSGGSYGIFDSLF